MTDKKEQGPWIRRGYPLSDEQAKALRDEWIKRFGPLPADNELDEAAFDRARAQAQEEEE